MPAPPSNPGGHEGEPPPPWRRPTGRVVPARRTPSQENRERENALPEGISEFGRLKSSP